MYKIFQAIKCYVSGVVPAAGEWSEDCVTTVKALLLEQYCSIKVTDILEEEVLTCAVDIVLQSSGKKGLFFHTLSSHMFLRGSTEPWSGIKYAAWSFPLGQNGALN